APASAAPSAPGAAASAASASRVTPLMVRTSQGSVRGTYAAPPRDFLGRPYAAPPTGTLRWQPPQPAAPWRGVRTATTQGPDCAQTGSLATGVITSSTGEACLYLNVYTPKAAGRRPLPVMVWIHGGAFT